MSNVIVIRSEPLQALCEQRPDGWYHVRIEHIECGSLVEEHICQHLDNVEGLIEDEADKLQDDWVRYGP